MTALDAADAATFSARRAQSRAERRTAAPAVEQGNAGETNDLLRILIMLAGRLAVPPEQLPSLVSPKSNVSYLKAYSLCDGRTALRDLVAETGIDKGSLSKTIAKWVDDGIAFRVGPEQYPLHLYPLPGYGRRTSRGEGETTVRSGRGTQSTAIGRAEQASANGQTND